MLDESNDKNDISCIRCLMHHGGSSSSALGVARIPTGGQVNNLVN